MNDDQELKINEMLEGELVYKEVDYIVPLLTPDEEAELKRQLEAARMMAAAGPLPQITPGEAALYGWSPEEVAEFNENWTEEEAQASAAQCQVRLSLLTKLAALAGV